MYDILLPSWVGTSHLNGFILEAPFSELHIHSLLACFHSAQVFLPFPPNFPYTWILPLKRRMNFPSTTFCLKAFSLWMHVCFLVSETKFIIFAHVHQKLLHLRDKVQASYSIKLLDEKAAWFTSQNVQAIQMGITDEWKNKKWYIHKWNRIQS